MRLSILRAAVMLGCVLAPHSFADEKDRTAQRDNAAVLATGLRAKDALDRIATMRSLVQDRREQEAVFLELARTDPGRYPTNGTAKLAIELLGELRFDSDEVVVFLIQNAEAKFDGRSPEGNDLVLDPHTCARALMRIGTPTMYRMLPVTLAGDVPELRLVIVGHVLRRTDGRAEALRRVQQLVDEVTPGTNRHRNLSKLAEILQRRSKVDGTYEDRFYDSGG
jgi:hypothetical protein